MLAKYEATAVPVDTVVALAVALVAQVVGAGSVAQLEVPEAVHLVQAA